MYEKFCDYVTGMLSLEPHRPGNNLTEYVCQRRASTHHEAGHAVVGYALGCGLGGIGMRTRVWLGEHNETTTGYEGRVYPTATWDRKARRALSAGKFGDTLLAYGIKAAAGAAAEYKYCLWDDFAVRTRETAINDHVNIILAGNGLEGNGRNPAAYRRLVWRRAQLALEEPSIWRAVVELAYELEEYIPDEEEVGTYENIMSGSTARAIIRSHGVRNGMLVPKELETAIRT